MADGEEVDFVPDSIEGVDDPVVPDAETVAVAAGHAVVGIGSESQAYVVKVGLDPVANVVRQLQEHLVDGARQRGDGHAVRDGPEASAQG